MKLSDNSVSVPRLVGRWSASLGVCTHGGGRFSRLKILSSCYVNVCGDLQNRTKNFIRYKGVS